jgi:hypothetical protein
MKILQVVPCRNNRAKLKSLMIQKERDLRGRGTTFVRQRAGRWQHTKHPGWINWDEASGGILVAEVQSRAEDSEWQLLQAFVGYLDRHFSDHIESITITYR